MRLLLRPLAAADLPVVRPWFEDADTRRWLGGPHWADETLALADPTLGRHALLASVDGIGPCGLADVEVKDGGRAGFAIVVAPQVRRKGIGAATLDALPGYRPLSQLVELFAGVEDGNEASARLLRAAGFVRVTDIDGDGFRYYARRLDGRPPIAPWRVPD